MSLKCGDHEVEPIQPAKVAKVIDVHNYFVNVTDATYEGFYTYPADAISPACGTVSLELYSEKNPESAKVRVLDKKVVERVWDDFEPYRKSVLSKVHMEPPIETGAQLTASKNATVSLSQAAAPEQRQQTVAAGANAGTAQSVPYPALQQRSIATAPPPQQGATVSSNKTQAPSIPDSQTPANSERPKTSLMAKLKSVFSTEPDQHRSQTTPTQTTSGQLAIQPQFALSDLTVLSQPSGADILVDGYPAGRTPAVIKLSPGTYKLTVRSPGFETWTQLVIIEPAQVRSLGVEMAKPTK